MFDVHSRVQCLNGLSTEGAAQTVGGKQFHTVMVDGRNENLYTSTLPDVVGLSAASYSRLLLVTIRLWSGISRLTSTSLCIILQSTSLAGVEVAPILGYAACFNTPGVP